MGLFTPDLFRSFGIGFLLGALALYATVGGTGEQTLRSSVMPSAVAATAK